MKKSGFTGFLFGFASFLLLSATLSMSLAAVGNASSPSAFVGSASANFHDSAEQIAGLSKFDPRDELTPVKDQGDTNLCWAYSAINASEAAILKQRLGTKETLRLNPQALAYRKYVRNTDPLGNNASYHSSYAGEWLSRAGQIGQTPALLSMWQGPIAGDKPAANVAENTLYRFESANLISSDLTGDERIAELKRAIAEYGAVTASCYYDGGTKLYYNDNAVTNGIPHAITLVGWDDGIDGSLFKPGQVTRNGGWLVKNSYSDNGYFWLTYESKISPTTAWTFTYAPKEAYDFNYYYDNSETDFGLSNIRHAANVYEAKKGTADRSEYLEAVNIGFTGNNATVTVRVYTGLSGWGASSVESGAPAAEKTQTFRYGGYNTVRLDTPVRLAAGSYFSVIAEISSPDGTAKLMTVQTDTKKPSFAKSSGGYDFISYGGQIARIKAYTKLRDTEPGCVSHRYGELIPSVAPTCSSEGMKAHYRCSECGGYFDENRNETDAEALRLAIEPDAHDLSPWVNEVPATCTEKGVKGHADCRLCGRHYASDEATEITDLAIPTNDSHDWRAPVSNGNGTHTRICARDPSHTETEDCSGGTATCVTPAVCVLCGNSYGTPAPHRLGAWIDEIPATEEAEGVKGHRKCTVCGRCFDANGAEITDLTIEKPAKPTIPAPAPVTVTVTVTNGTGGGRFSVGERITVKADTPAEGKRFGYWQTADGNAVSTDAAYTFTVTGEVSLTAVYEDLPSAGNASGGSDPAPESPKPENPAPEEKDTEKKKLPGGAIAGIAIGSAATAGFGGFAFVRFLRRKKHFGN